MVPLDSKHREHGIGVTLKFDSIVGCQASEVDLIFTNRDQTVLHPIFCQPVDMPLLGSGYPSKSHISMVINGVIIPLLSNIRL